MNSTLTAIICLIAQALDLLGLQASETRLVDVTWRGRGNETTYRVKVGNYTVGWNVKGEQEAPCQN